MRNFSNYISLKRKRERGRKRDGKTRADELLRRKQRKTNVKHRFVCFPTRNRLSVSLNLCICWLSTLPACARTMRRPHLVDVSPSLSLALDQLFATTNMPHINRTTNLILKFTSRPAKLNQNKNSSNSNGSSSLS